MGIRLLLALPVADLLEKDPLHPGPTLHDRGGKNPRTVCPQALWACYLQAAFAGGRESQRRRLGSDRRRRRRKVSSVGWSGDGREKVRRRKREKERDREREREVGRKREVVEGLLSCLNASTR